MGKRTSWTLLLLICGAFLTGCGQKGPLHVPAEREQIQGENIEQTTIPETSADDRPE